MTAPRRQHAPNPCGCGCGEYPRNFYAKFIAGHRPPASRDDVIARFWAKVDKRDGDGCWIWTGAIGSHGYGTFWDGTDFILTHRFSLALADRLDPQLTTDHLCRTRPCVRPDHLENVTQAENNRRMQAVIRERATECKRGHEFTAENTFRNSSGYRECRTCIRDRNAAAYAARKATR